MDANDGNSVDAVMLTVDEFLDLTGTGSSKCEEFVVSHRQEKHPCVVGDCTEVLRVADRLGFRVAKFSN